MDDLLEARYKAQVIPELYPEMPQPRLENWNEEDLQAYCGGEYTRDAWVRKLNWYGELA